MSKRASKRAGSGRRPGLETLEERCTPATASGTIQGTAFIDRNANGVFNAGEQVLAGAPVVLTGTNQLGNQVKLTAVSNAAGTYRFNNVLPGTYFVSPGRAPGAMQNVPVNRTPLVVPTTTTANFTLTRAVGFGGPAPGTVSWRQLLTNPIRPFQYGPTGTGSLNATYRPNDAPTLVGAGIADQEMSEDGTKFVDMAEYFTDANFTRSRVRFVVQKFTAGVGFRNTFIDVDLYDKDAPRTVANFFNYVTANRYDNTVFHRLATQAAAGGGALQGGGFKFDPVTDKFLSFLTGDEPTVANEYNSARTNVTGTLSMARTADLNSATSQFFFNTTNNSSTFANYTVFGQIVGSTTILNTLLSGVQSADGTAGPTVPHAANLGPGFADVPTNGAVRKVTGDNTSPFVVPANPTNKNFLILKDVRVLKRDEWLTYSLVDANGNSVQELTNGSIKAQFVNNQLKLTTLAGASGVATFKVRATDRFGSSVTDEFSVTAGAVNDKPVRTAPATLTPISVDEDSSNTTAVSLGLSGVTYGPGGGADEAGQTLTYTVTAIPSFITVYHADGTTPVTAGTTVTLAELQGLTYKTVADANGTGNVVFTVKDDGGTLSGGQDTLTETLAVTVSAVNDAPAVTVTTSATPTTTANTDLTFADVDLGITIADVDVTATDELEVTLTVTDGTLSLVGTTAGLTVSDNDGTDGTLTFKGTAAVLDNALATLVYQPGNDDNDDVLTVLVSDLGKTGSGGAKTDTDTVSIVVN